MGLFSKLRSSISRIVEEVKDFLGIDGDDDDDEITPEAPLFTDDDFEDIASYEDDDKGGGIVTDDPDSKYFEYPSEENLFLEYDQSPDRAAIDDISEADDYVLFAYDGDAMSGAEDGRHYYISDYVITLVTGAELHGTIKYYGELDNITAAIFAANPDLQSTDVLSIDVLDYPEMSRDMGFSMRYGSKY